MYDLDRLVIHRQPKTVDYWTVPQPFSMKAMKRLRTGVKRPFPGSNGGKRSTVPRPLLPANRQPP